jgi:outer membrane protein assembly factor BamD
MKFYLIKILPVLFVVMIIGTSCKYQKLLKSTDNELKYTKAKAYYENKDYAKAMELFDQLKPIFRGTDRGEEVSYLYAYCNYYLKDYIMAGHYFRNFTESFPLSSFTTEAAYMSAYCYYLDAPKSSLDQETTKKALTEFELYIRRYPQSDKINDCNKLMDELRYRLEKKSFENALLYYDLGQFKAAVVSFKASIKEYPDSKFREDILFYTLKSNYLYAVNSIYGKTRERLSDASKDYKAFVKAYPESKYNKDASKIYEEISKRIVKIN